MKRRRLGAMLAATAAVTAISGVAYGWRCAVPVGQEASLELVSVTVDGVPQGDLTDYRGLEPTLTAASSEATGTDLVLRTNKAGQRSFYQDFFLRSPGRGP